VSAPKWIDIHAHLDMLESSPAETLAFAESQGVERIITIGTEESDLPIVLQIAKDFFPRIACTLGVHPHHGSGWSEKIRDYLLTHLPEPEVVALGEIGLDYYYKQSPPEEQKLAFREQLEIAAQLKMPVEIHTREAEVDTAEILKEFRGRVTGVLHCFTSSQWLADQSLDLGFHISMSGVVTFKNADDLRAVCRRIPSDRLHVETDSPFLAPIPQRGKKNCPGFVVHTAEFVAGLRGVSTEVLSEQVGKNARQLFPKLNW
jgi:TatD DNase family protein